MHKRLIGVLKDEVNKSLSFAIDKIIKDSIVKNILSEEFYSLLYEDLLAFSRRNPAAAPAHIIASTSIGFNAVLSYRLSHEILTSLNEEEKFELAAFSIYETSYGKTGIDIHPRCKIGPGLVIDHGWGTVVGETCEIGSSCYLLGGIILGAIGIAGNANEKRHPKLGDNVQVGQFSRILGPINIGNNVLIAAQCVITDDIPADSSVNIINQLQCTKKKLSTLKFYGVIPLDSGFEILGEGLEIIDSVRIEGGLGGVDLIADIHKKNDSSILVYLSQHCLSKIEGTKNVILTSKGSDAMVIVQSRCLEKIKASQINHINQHSFNIDSQVHAHNIPNPLEISMYDKNS